MRPLCRLSWPAHNDSAGQHAAAMSAQRVRLDAASVGAGALYALATPPALDEHAFAAGVGLSAGGVGVEWIQRFRLNWASGVGAGVAGFGGRDMGYPFTRIGRVWSWQPYVAPSFLYTPWASNRMSGSGALAIELGAQRWGGERDWFADVGLGVARITGGHLARTPRFATHTSHDRSRDALLEFQ